MNTRIARLSKSLATCLAAAVLSIPCQLAAAGSTCWNSVTDFGTVQGANDWYYGYWVMPGMNFTLMTEFGVAQPNAWSADFLRPGPSYWTLINPSVMHPNGSVNNGNKTLQEQEAVLRWVSPITGNIQVDFHTDCSDVGGFGTTFQIRYNGNLTTSLPIGPADTVGIDAQTFVPVVPGDTLDFIVNTGGGNAINDSTTVEVTISVVGGVFADLNNDCVVDGADLGLLLGAWNTAGPFADLNNDNTVDCADLGLLLGAWT